MLHRTRLRPPQSCGDDYALKAHVAAWRGISAVLQDAAHSAR
jgi:hypothetical protein